MTPKAIIPKTIIWMAHDIDLIDAVVAPLEAAGYEIVRLRSAQAARERIETLRQADLILLGGLTFSIDSADPVLRGPGAAVLPGQYYLRYPGLLLLQELRQIYQVSTPAVVLTVIGEKGHEELYQQLRALGVVDIVCKPVLPSDLKTCVEAALGRTLTSF